MKSQPLDPREVAPRPDFERAPDGAVGALEEQTPCSSCQGQGIRAPSVGNMLLRGASAAAARSVSFLL